MVNQESTVAAVADWVCAHSTSKDSLGSIAPIKHRAARFAKEVGLYTISVAPLTMRSAGWRRGEKEKKKSEKLCVPYRCAYQFVHWRKRATHTTATFVVHPFDKGDFIVRLHYRAGQQLDTPSKSKSFD